MSLLCSRDPIYILISKVSGMSLNYAEYTRCELGYKSITD